MKTALICGVSGQDGALLAKLLIDRGYCVIGASRDAQIAPMDNLRKLKIYGRVILESMSLTDFRSITQVLSNYEIDEIYNLSGQSSVGLSFEQPVMTIESIALATVNLLEAIRLTRKTIRVYNASSGECFGEIGDFAAKEDWAFNPRSPYGIAKSTAHWVIRNYRETYGIWSCNGILFNHESPLRPERFVTMKIVATAYRISQGSSEQLKLGTLAIRRDWGWAPEYVDAMWRMMQLDQPDDFVIATGESNSLEQFVELAFAEFGLDWRRHVTLDTTRQRPLDIIANRGCADKAERILGWRARNMMADVVKKMVHGMIDGPEAVLS